MSDKVEKQNTEELVKLRFTLSSPSVKRIENTSQEIVAQCKRSGYVPRGPVRLPTKVLTISTRKTPNGEGSKTWDTYEMRIHKRIILVVARTEDIASFVGRTQDSKVHMTITFSKLTNEE